MSSTIPAPLHAVPLDYVDSCHLPTTWANFRMHAFVEPGSGKEHIALTLGVVDDGAPVLARIHSECLTGDALFSQRCDCGPQLELALQKIAEAGRGVLLYLRQEGRGIGLLNKVRAYHLQDDGADTVEANQRLGFAADLRNYGLCDPMLRHLGIRSLRLMTNNPRKLAAMAGLNVLVAEHVPLIIERNVHNNRYLNTKASKLGHLMQADLSVPSSDEDLLL
ncbi:MULTISPECIES: GTP cyclohydrolase II [unclassified Undibacterium]|uniref:GTP cyclohydrolase II n=1 Tax=unclassified Undibacterium TaxID=2630295 RepID=UPI002AC8D552|nr:MULTISPECIES: GTP cyclohydrolase II [unclassified Undibacterium]MEB0139169.1 GTP cyclohydrolase II [Undibacterium sp. CCC2.1]MEB0172256.1 GTP cyclohydrolase II [Undibacterium sp. CCC1.1]MEB0175887.1 GTP cyclohydrolase II [Undibacterium sp. CCC3.4]MEB0215253.1 GTP cyclohydrolase II [Undibacterium sp. 5I2]WPX43551.1 GTP cyclohydrolase II [Undibacterium sp. CCC3.4]